MIVLAGLLALAFPVTVWLFLRHIDRLTSTYEARTSELLTRIQHPEIVRPEIPTHRVEVAPTEPEDEMHLIGTISGGSTMNGDNADT